MSLRKGKRLRIRTDGEPWNAATLLAALASRYPAPEYAFLTDVRSHTGMAPAGTETRTADAVALGLWGSRGRHLHGFEVKVSRGDWLREKGAPQKAEAIARYCDFWWVVAANAEVVAEGELPNLWGLLVPRGGRLIAVREAQALQPQPIDRLFLGALLRRVTEPPSDEAFEARVQGRLATARERWEAQHKVELDRAQQRAAQEEREAQALRDFEAASGLKIGSWNAGQIGRVVALATRYDAASLFRDLHHAVERAQSFVDPLRTALAELAAFAPVPPEVVLGVTHPDVPLRLLVDRTATPPHLPRGVLVPHEAPDDAARRLLATCGQGPLPDDAGPRLLGHRLTGPGDRPPRVHHLFWARAPRPDWTPPAPYEWAHLVALLTEPGLTEPDLDLLCLYRGRLETGRLATPNSPKTAP